jgi:hypothetical protein
MKPHFRMALVPALTALAFFSIQTQTAKAGVDPALLSLMMPDAKAVSGIQVDQSQASPFGRYILSQMAPGADFSKIIAATGFDPLHDLHEIVGSANGTPASGLIAGRGAFQPSKIASLAVAAGATSQVYRGVEILTTPAAQGNGPSASIAFPDGATVLIGDAAAVKSALDRRAAGTKFSGSLADKAKQVSAANDAWFASTTPPTSILGNALNDANGAFSPANLLRAVLESSGGVKFASTSVTVSAEAITRSSQDAQALVDVLKFVTGMIQSNRDKDPSAGKIATLADSAQISATGSVMRLVLAVPEDQIEKLLMPATATPASRQRPKRVAAVR